MRNWFCILQPDLIFDIMRRRNDDCIVEKKEIISQHLQRAVLIDFYLPRSFSLLKNAALILFNDGQLLKTMNLQQIIKKLYRENKIDPIIIAGIYAGEARKQEYGTAGIPNYKGEGSRANIYTDFILQELLTFIYQTYPVNNNSQLAFAGFSLGGLSALDMVWNHANIFQTAAVFSGSLWWRSKALDDGYDDATDRIMLAQINKGNYRHGLQFFFECGTKDETVDRNNNGKIDAVEDTEDIIAALKNKGYDQKDLHYLLIENGRHDEATWAKAIPEFLLWGWGR